MDGLPAMHVNTMLLILISALYADARLCRASPARTKRQGRERRGRTQNENGLSQIATPSIYSAPTSPSMRNFSEARRGPSTFPDRLL
jgi:hypothetical protein